MSNKFIIYIAILLLSSGMVSSLEAKSLSEATLSIHKDIDSATAELNKVRDEITEEKISSSEKLNKLRSDVRELRMEYDSLQALSWKKDSELEKLKEDITFLEEEVAFASSLLTEYRRDMVRRMSGAEEAFLNEDLKEIDRLSQADQSSETLTALPALITLVTQKNQLNLGGYSFPGHSLDKQGMLLDGEFVQVGPITYFVSDDNLQGGLIGLHFGSANPAIVMEFNPQTIRELIEGKNVSIPVDLTLGEAIKIKESRQSWMEHIKAGGIIMIPILGLGFVCFIVAVGKFFSLGRLRTNMGRIIPSIVSSLAQGNMEEAKEKARALGRPAGPVLLEGIEHHHTSREHLEEIMHERILVQIPYLEKWLPFLAVAAAAAPLLGLLGTVTGMIHTFNLVTIFGSGKAKLLSGGISEALITTEYGLIIAIPALLIHAYLSRRVRKLVNSLDHGAVAFINAVIRLYHK